MIFGMCRYIFVGFHMELVLKCAKTFFFSKNAVTGKKSLLMQIFFFLFSFKEAYYHVRVKLCEAVSF